MAKTITIEMADDGKIMVSTSDGGEPYMCETIAECRQYVDDMLAAEEQGAEDMEGPRDMEGPQDMSGQQMWNQEAKTRQPQPGLMA